MTSVTEAESLIRARMVRWPSEQIRIESATGRVLTETVVAERDQPPFDRVTMDGIAIASASWARGTRRYRIEQIQAAGVAAAVLEEPDACIRVMTGAVRPEGTDAVIPIERIAIDDGVATVDGSAIAEPGRFIHAQGSDRRCGDTVLEPGIRLGPAEIAVLASAGRPLVAVTRRPRIAVISTGDELVTVDATDIAPFQIRSSNDLAIAASIERAGCGTCTRLMLPDDPEEILQQTVAAHEASDVLILSGGVSMGDFDFVPAALERLGSELVFHRIAQKPGRPMWFGITRAGKPVFALPGNPVSTLLCMTRYVVPALRQALGERAPAPEYAALSAAVDGPKELTYFCPMRLHFDDAGRAHAAPRPTNTSGDFATLATTDGFIELADSPRGRYETGTVGRVFRW